MSNLIMRCNIDIELAISNIDLFDICVKSRIRISFEIQLN